MTVGGQDASIQGVLIGAGARLRRVEIEHDDRYYDWMTAL
jgi:hypothetical protein